MKGYIVLSSFCFLLYLFLFPQDTKKSPRVKIHLIINQVGWVLLMENAISLKYDTTSLGHDMIIHLNY
ncbi:hypothetical protein AAHE18_05G181900 [Arachis hypogaea]